SPGWLAIDSEGAISRVSKSTPGREPRPQIYNPTNITTGHGVTIFVSRELRGIWRTDGTAIGTQRVTSDPTLFSSPQVYAILGKSLLYTDAPTGVGQKVYRTSLSGGRPTIVATIPEHWQVREMVAAGSRVFYRTIGTNTS